MTDAAVEALTALLEKADALIEEGQALRKLVRAAVCERVTKSELCELWGVNTRTITRMVAKGRLPKPEMRNGHATWRRTDVEGIR